MKSYQADYDVATLCRMLGVSTSGYYAWLNRTPSQRQQADIALGDRIEAYYKKSHSTYGRMRLRAICATKAFA